MTAVPSKRWRCYISDGWLRHFSHQNRIVGVEHCDVFHSLYRLLLIQTMFYTNSPSLPNYLFLSSRPGGFPCPLGLERVAFFATAFSFTCFFSFARAAAFAAWAPLAVALVLLSVKKIQSNETNSYFRVRFASGWSSSPSSSSFSACVSARVRLGAALGLAFPFLTGAIGVTDSWTGVVFRSGVRC